MADASATSVETPKRCRRSGRVDRSRDSTVRRAFSSSNTSWVKPSRRAGSGTEAERAWRSRRSALRGIELAPLAEQIAFRAMRTGEDRARHEIEQRAGLAAFSARWNARVGSFERRAARAARK